MCSPIDGECKCPPGFEGEFCQRSRKFLLLYYQLYLSVVFYFIEILFLEKYNKYFLDVLNIYAGVVYFLSFAGCSDGYWGVNCMNNCTCSDRKMCDSVTGSCQCASGLKGEQCDQYCDVGFWGPDCVKECQCRVDTSTCQAPTGECVCHAGYLGKRCEKRKCALHVYKHHS